MGVKNSNAITYRGNVKVSYKKRGSNITFINHNDGKPPLFKTIAQSLIGYGINHSIPDKVNLVVSVDGDESSYVGCLRSPAQISRRVVVGNDNGTYSSIYTSLLNKANITVFNGVKYKLQLMDIDNVVLADSMIDTSVITDVGEGTGVEALIEWALTFQNKTAEDSEENEGD